MRGRAETEPTEMCGEQTVLTSEEIEFMRLSQGLSKTKVNHCLLTISKTAKSQEPAASYRLGDI